MRRRMICVLGMALLAVVSGPALAREPQSPDAKLRENLSTWQQTAAQLEAVRKELAETQVAHDPEREDRMWWNPLWRSSRQGHLQHANELTLRIQLLDRKLRALEPVLLRQTAKFCKEAIARPQSLGPESRELWNQADAWRMPILLKEPDWRAFDYQSTADQGPEIVANRRAALAQLQQRWQESEIYLRVRQATGGLPEVANWLVQVESRLKRAQSALQAFPTEKP